MGAKTMQPSYYNTIIGFDGNTILYNAFTGRFIVVKGHDLTRNGSNLCEIAKETPGLERQLYENGFLLENPDNQLIELKTRIKEACADPSTFLLNVNPTVDCNFNCWYCYEEHQRDSVMNGAVISSVKKLIRKKVKSNPDLRQFQLGFFGGEPLLQFDHVCRPIIEYSSKVCRNAENVGFSIGFTSNGSLVTDEMIDFLSRYDCSFQITLDGGEEKHNLTRFFRGGVPSYKLIINNIKKLAKSGVAVIVRVNFTGINIDSAMMIPDEFCEVEESAKRFVRFDIQRVWQDRSKNTDETDQKAEILRRTLWSRGFTVLTNNLKADARYVCYGDRINHLLINYNGDVFGCTARDFVAKNRIGVLEYNGLVRYDGDVNIRRDLSKFVKKVCQKCRIAPICGGGCKQRAFEDVDSDECTFRYTDKNIDDMILDIFDYQYCRTAQG